MNEQRSFSRKATGNCTPCRFAKADTSIDDGCAQAGAGEVTIGIFAPDTHKTPLSGLDDGYHATSGESAAIFGPGSRGIQLDLGGTVTAGDFLKSDSNGKGVTTTTDKDWVGAKALESGVSGERIRVEPMGFYLSV